MVLNTPQTEYKNFEQWLYNKRSAETNWFQPTFNAPPKTPLLIFNYKTKVSDPSKLAYLQSLKRSLVGVGGLEVRGRQCLALTSAY